MTIRPTLTEPLLVDRFWRDRAGRAIFTQLKTFEGHNIVDVRTFFTHADGSMRPAKGLSCSVTRLPDLLKALQKAYARAVELGLIDADGGRT
jgi:hypothetical protein